MRALVASGDRLELGALRPHRRRRTTGGVGDSVPVVAAPLAAALGVRVAQMASRGLATPAARRQARGDPRHGGRPVARPLRAAAPRRGHRGGRPPRPARARRPAPGGPPRRHRHGARAPGWSRPRRWPELGRGRRRRCTLEIPVGAGGFVARPGGGAREAAALMERMAAPWGRTVTLGRSARWTRRSAACVGQRARDRARRVRCCAAAGPDDAARRRRGPRGGPAGRGGRHGAGGRGARRAPPPRWPTAPPWRRPSAGWRPRAATPPSGPTRAPCPSAPERVDVVAPRAGAVTRHRRARGRGGGPLAGRRAPAPRPVDRPGRGHRAARAHRRRVAATASRWPSSTPATRGRPARPRGWRRRWFRVGEPRRRA